MATQNQKGTGSVIQHSSGSWLARRRYTVDGKKLEWGKYFPTKKKAETALKEFNKSLLEGKAQPQTKAKAKPDTDSEETFGQFLKWALKHVYRPRLKPSTYRLYEMFVRIHLSSLHDIKLCALGVGELERAINEPRIVRRVLSARTKASLRRFCIGALGHAVRLGKLTDNVATRTLLKDKVKNRVIKALSAEQLLMLVEQAGDPYYTMFLMQATCGLRIGEVCALMETDLNGDVLNISRQVQRVGKDEDELTAETLVHDAYKGKGRKRKSKNVSKSKLIVQDLKTEKSNRQVSVLPQVLERLEILRKCPAGWLFCTSKGTPIEPRNVMRALAKVAEKAGLVGVTTHVLRHTYATLQVQSGTPLVVIKDALGHSQLSTTTIYAEATIEPIREANEKLGALLFK